jgi:hypothetical protein
MRVDRRGEVTSEEKGNWRERREEASYEPLPMTGTMRLAATSPT